MLNPARFPWRSKTLRTSSKSSTISAFSRRGHRTRKSSKYPRRLHRRLQQKTPQPRGPHYVPGSSVVSSNNNAELRIDWPLARVSRVFTSDDKPTRKLGLSVSSEGSIRTYARSIPHKVLPLPAYYSYKKVLLTKKLARGENTPKYQLWNSAPSARILFI